jgi:uncharacterized protein
MTKYIMLTNLAVCSLANFAEADVAHECLAYLDSNNYQLAVSACANAAARGDASAQTNLGMMYADGLGVERDLQEAMRLYFEASKQGNLAARMLLAFQYLRGQGVAADSVLALKWFILAAEDNNELAAIMRDNQASNMAAEEIADAQTRAQQCVDSNFSDC